MQDQVPSESGMVVPVETRGFFQRNEWKPSGEQQPQVECIHIADDIELS